MCLPCYLDHSSFGDGLVFGDQRQVLDLGGCHDRGVEGVFREHEVTGFMKNVHLEEYEVEAKALQLRCPLFERFTESDATCLEENGNFPDDDHGDTDQGPFADGALKDLECRGYQQTLADQEGPICRGTVAGLVSQKRVP